MDKSCISRTTNSNCSHTLIDCEEMLWNYFLLPLSCLISLLTVSAIIHITFSITEAHCNNFLYTMHCEHCLVNSFSEMFIFFNRELSSVTMCQARQRNLVGLLSEGISLWRKPRPLLYLEHWHINWSLLSFAFRRAMPRNVTLFQSSLTFLRIGHKAFEMLGTQRICVCSLLLKHSTHLIHFLIQD
jgi:hypothetical protein